MLKFILHRIFLEALPTLFVIATLTFFMVRLAPGGPFSREKQVSAEVQKRLDAYYGLDKPLVVQYGRYLANVAHGDLGPSFKHTSESVNELIAGAFPVSLELGLWALLFAIVTGVGAGIVASLRPNTWTDAAPMTLAMAGLCLPSFVLGPLLLLLFGLTLGWVNVAGWNTAGDRILPAITLGAGYAAYLARLTRAGMRDVLSQDFIRTARAKGLSPARVIGVHALKGGLLPSVSFLGPAVAGLITGTFVVESIFQIPGLGQIIVNAAFNRDYFLILGAVVFIGFVMIAMNLLVDVAQALMNPRLRVGE
jgi:oligopeptide transport system permease protein